MWSDTVREKISDLESIASWASQTNLGQVRDAIRNATYELKKELKRPFSDTCPRCGGLLRGDGKKIVVRCENADEADYWDLEPDANPIYCNSSGENDETS